MAYEVEGQNCVEIPVNFVSKYGVLRALNLNNLKTAESIISYDTESSEMQLEVDTTKQVINYKGTIVNNFEAPLNNVEIIGRVPMKGVKDGNGTLLDATFDMSLASSISTSGLLADVYYSEDLYAGKDKIIISGYGYDRRNSVETNCYIYSSYANRKYCTAAV